MYVPKRSRTNQDDASSLVADNQLRVNHPSFSQHSSRNSLSSQRLETLASVFLVKFNKNLCCTFIFPSHFSKSCSSPKLQGGSQHMLGPNGTHLRSQLSSVVFFGTIFLVLRANPSFKFRRIISLKWLNISRLMFQIQQAFSCTALRTFRHGLLVNLGNQSVFWKGRLRQY